MKRLAFALLLLATPAVAQQPTPQQRLQQSIALKIGTLELENAQLGAALQEVQRELVQLRAENEKLKLAAKKPDEPKAEPAPKP